MERGQLDMRVLEDTFGFFPPAGQQAVISRQDKIKRARRFVITFQVNVSQADFADGDMALLNGQVFNASKTTYVLQHCKVDTMSFGATSGRNIVANQWQGTSEGILIL
jgi:hypothetical protein